MTVATPTSQLPCLTAALPGVGGEIKQSNEDFLVEEIPLYAASGAGTHVYFTIEKSGMTTLGANEAIARALGKRPNDIGYAGMKDAHGITRQMLSVEHVPPERVEQLDLRNIRVLSVSRHTNKIKLGHLAGNRFVINVRDADPAALPKAKAIFEILTRRGLPNYFGPQRFGARGDNAQVGRAILQDDYAEAIAIILGRPDERDRNDIRRARKLFDEGRWAEAADAWPRGIPDQARMARAYAASGGDARAAWRAVGHTLRKLYVSAIQSELFNEVVARRIDGLDRIELGDLAWKHRNGSCFRVEDPAVEQPRCDALEISPSGPLFGKRMTKAEGRPGELEAAVLAESGIPEECFTARDGSKLDGARRPLRVPLAEASCEAGADTRGPFLQLRFVLPPGAYATALTREVCK